jgi:DNA modification methylase
MSDTYVRYLIGDARSRIAELPDGSVQSVITSPPYLRKRAYLAADDPAKPLEIGQEDSPGDFLAALLALTDDLWRVLRDDGTIWINLGDTAAFSGGAGGDYNEGGLREGQARYEGSARAAVSRADWPLAKSVCWIPQLFGASLAYGRNLLTGEPCRQWVTRPPVTWCKPNPPVGEIIDKFREATELIVWAAKTSKPGGYYFDLDSIREPNNPDNDRTTWNQQGPKQKMAEQVGKATSGRERFTKRTCNEKGKPPLDWWEIPTKPYAGAHFATFPEALIYRPVIASCPPGGTILDCFAGSGTTLAVAFGNGRSSIGIDLDARNAELARQRVGMWLEVEPAHALALDVPPA